MPKLFQFFDQTGLAKPRRWFGEMLDRLQPCKVKASPGCKSGNGRIFFLSRQGRQHPCKPVEFQNAAANPQLKVSCLGFNRCAQIFRIGHLASHELITNEVVKTHCIRIHAIQLFGRTYYIRRSNCLVSLLGIILSRVGAFLFGQVSVAVFAVDVFSTSRHCFRAQVGGICPHVRDVTSLVKALRHGHGFLHRETQPSARRLL
jgi:hypothetical protein